MLQRISTQIVFILFDASLKAILIWALATLVIRTFRGMSVHAQHCVWTVVLLALLVLPIVAHAGPTWSLPPGIWPLRRPAVNSDGAKSQSASADSGPGVLNGQVTNSPGRSSNPRQQESLGVASSGARIDHARTGGPPFGTASIETDGRQASAVASSHPQSFRRWSWLFVLGSFVWLIGVGVMLIRLSIAALQTLRIQRAALPVIDSSFPIGMVVRESDRIESPVVAGWWRPCILLPHSWREWTAAKRAAVFAHEQSHLRRRDPQLSLLAELVTLIYWFHHVSWWTKRRLSRLAELACDEAAAIAIGDRLVYARYLVEIAARQCESTRGLPVRRRP